MGVDQPDYSRLARVQAEAWARDRGPAAAREKLRVHVSNWKHPRGPLFVAGHMAINEVEQRNNRLTSERNEKAAAPGRANGFIDGRDGLGRPGSDSADLDQKDPSHDQ